MIFKTRDILNLKKKKKKVIQYEAIYVRAEKSF